MTEENATPHDRSRRDGFTLIEIMAVVVIMGMLMAVLAVGVSGQIDNARAKTAQLHLSRIGSALEFYKMDNSRFPNTDQGLEALVRQPTAAPLPRNYNPQGYINEEQLVDPWGEPFQYRQPGEHNPYTFDIWSFGPDGVEGGDDDIANWTISSDA